MTGKDKQHAQPATEPFVEPLGHAPPPSHEAAAAAAAVRRWPMGVCALPRVFDVRSRIYWSCTRHFGALSSVTKLAQASR